MSQAISTMLAVGREAWKQLHRCCPTSILAGELRAALTSLDDHQRKVDMDTQRLIDDLDELIATPARSDAAAERIVLLSFALIASHLVVLTDHAANMAESLNYIAGSLTDLAGCVRDGALRVSK